MKLLCSSEINKIPNDLETLLGLLQNADFAEKCRYKLKYFQRRFSCEFYVNGKYSKEFNCHVKDLHKLIGDISILEEASKR